MEDVYIIEGVLGGDVTSSRNQGQNAARFFLAYEHGRSIVNLPPMPKSPNAWIFDDRSLQQYGIDLPDDIRSQAVVLHPRPGMYGQFKSVIVCIRIVSAALLFSAVSVSIVFLSKKTEN